MNRTTAVWKPVWHELDQSLVVGERADFAMIITSSPIRFANGVDIEEATAVSAKILSIHNSQLGEIVRIDTEGLLYRFFSNNETFSSIEAEETPGRIENGNESGSYLTDNHFLVEIELI